MAKRTKNIVPAQPFADWLNQRYAEIERRPRVSNNTTGELAPTDALCCDIGWMDGETALRRLWRYRTMTSETYVGRTDQKNLKTKGRPGVRGVRHTIPIESFPRQVVEDALEHAGVPFEELYPEIAATEEVWLEPRKWCPGCREARTPIDGQCPFCDWRLGPKTGQTLRGSRLVS